MTEGLTESLSETFLGAFLGGGFSAHTNANLHLNHLTSFSRDADIMDPAAWCGIDAIVVRREW